MRLFLTISCLLYFLTGIVCAETVSLSGAGELCPAYAKWIKFYNEKHPDQKVEFMNVGAGVGIKFWLDHTADFCTTESARIKAASLDALTLPVLGYPVVITFNLWNIKNLALSGEVLADIYLGRITKWNDKKISDLNPDIELPATEITPLYRRSGVFVQNCLLSGYLSRVSDDWKQTCGSGDSLKWPTALDGKEAGAGLYEWFAYTEGAIGYMEESMRSKVSSIIWH